MTSNVEKELFNSINLKFTSGNKIPVSQALQKRNGRVLKK